MNIYTSEQCIFFNLERLRTFSEVTTKSQDLNPSLSDLKCSLPPLLPPPPETHNPEI